MKRSFRIFEVMLATAEPRDMLAGKLIGVGAVGLTQIVIWLAAGVAIVAGSALCRSRFYSGNCRALSPGSEGVLFPVYFVLGFLFTVRCSRPCATCETEQELQMYMPLAAAPTWLSFALIVVHHERFQLLWSIWHSFFPPTAPFVMFLRMGFRFLPCGSLQSPSGFSS